MTFAELATARGITKKGAVTLIRRHGWRRQRDNQGHVIALVPPEWTTPDATGQAHRKADREASSEAAGEAAWEPSSGATSEAATPAFETALSAIEAAHAAELTGLRERRKRSVEPTLRDAVVV
jgi:hypothetical protein